MPPINIDNISIPVTTVAALVVSLLAGAFVIFNVYADTEAKFDSVEKTIAELKLEEQRHQTRQAELHANIASNLSQITDQLKNIADSHKEHEEELHQLGDRVMRLEYTTPGATQ